MEEGGRKNLINICNGMSTSQNISVVTANEIKKYFNKNINLSLDQIFIIKIDWLKVFFCIYLIQNYRNEDSFIFSNQIYLL